MKRDQYACETQGCEDIQQEYDIDHKIAHLIRQVKPSQCYDDLHKS